MEPEEKLSQPPLITQLLNDWRLGDQSALDQLIRIVYDDLKARAAAYMRGQRHNHTLQTTGLVHEAFIKLAERRDIEWKDRQHFLALASKVMRSVIIDYARYKNRGKRGGREQNLPFEETLHIVDSTTTPIDLIALDQALERLAELDERQAKIVELRYFGGMTIEEIAEILEISESTVKREFNIAKVWLRRFLE